MSLGLFMWGEEGQQFQTFTDKRYALGQKMVFMDGRQFRFVLAGGVTLVPGTLLQAAANVANHVNTAVQAATAIGATSIPITLGATTVTANQYADGYITIDVTPGQGFTYKIASSHPAVASSGTFTVPLAPGYSVQVALTTSSKASLTQNKWANVIINPTTATGVPVGVACSAAVNATYGWVQTHGEGNCLTNGTVVLGQAVVPGVTTAGTVEAFPAGAAETSGMPVGNVQRVGATTAQTIIDFNIGS